MSVTETLGGYGTWNIALGDDTPKAVLDALQFFGHIVIDIGNPDRAFLNDGMLKTARYVGQLNTRDIKGQPNTYGGGGMLLWMGDPDQKGQVIESLLTLTTRTFVQAMTAIMPTCLHIGTFFGTVPGTISTTFQYTDPKTAADYITSTMNAAYRVNGDGTVDAGRPIDLYRQVPICSLVRYGAGVDMRLRALPGDFDATSDVLDFTTRALLLAQGDSGSVVDATADIAPVLNPYRDFFNNPVKLTRMISESGTEAGLASTRAQLQLNRFSSTRDALTLSTTEYDIKGEVQVGDNIYVYDPETGLSDNNNEVIFMGDRLNPLILQCTELTYPIVDGMTVAYRDSTGKYTDLTSYVQFESGSTTVVVGGYNRALVSTSEPVGSRPLTDTSVPAAVTWVLPFAQAVYQSSVSGQTRAQVRLAWNVPLNVDGSVILDGDHYEINWRQSSTPIFPSTWAQLGGSAWNSLGEWEQPLVYPTGPWQSTVVGFDQITFMLQELLPTHPYEVRIRAVDAANPPNFGAWSATQTFQTLDDTIPPQTPAPPICDTSLIAVQVTHFLGADTGGTFNLDSDLHHLEIHAQYEPTYSPDDSTMLGKLPANAGMITGQIPVVGTFNVNGTEDLYFKVVAVDNAGNRSNPSAPTVGTPDLIDDEHITNLTASKITAGTISAAILLAGSIKTGLSGKRTEIDAAGIRGYDSLGNVVFNQNNSTGKIELHSGNATGQRIDILPDDGAGIPRIDIYDDDVTTHVTQVAFGGNYLTQRETNGTRANNGGFIEWDNTDSWYGMRNGSLDIWTKYDSAGRVHFKGSVPNGITASLGETVFWCAAQAFTVTTSNGSIIFGWGATMLGLPTPFCSMQNNDGTLFSSPFNVTTAQFTASIQHNGLSTTGVGTGTVNAWMVRRT